MRHIPSGVPSGSDAACGKENPNPPPAIRGRSTSAALLSPAAPYNPSRRRNFPVSLLVD